MNKLIILLLTALITKVSFGIERETRNVGDFKEVSLGLPVDVIVKQGNKNEVIVEGDSDDLELIETEVSGRELKIRNKKQKWNWGNNHSFRGVKIYITMKEIEGLYVSGSGSLTSDGTLKSDEIDVKVSGSGEVEADLDANEIYSKISGSGDIVLEGKSKYSSITISGSGGLSALNMEVENYDVKISGSGNCKIHVTSELEARISGSGRVRYKGSPSRVDAHSSGSGSVKKI